MPEQLEVGGRYSHSVQLCVPFRMILRVAVEFEDAGANTDVPGEPRTMLETVGWIAERVTVCGRSDAGRGKVAGCRGWANSSADEMASRANRADVLHL